MTRNVLLLTGAPGVGKTTVVERVGRLAGNLPLRGFLTCELRQDERRVGFELRTFSGARATLAHVKLDSPLIVGGYRVDLDALNRLLPGAMGQTSAPAVYLIDEIGRMECMSSDFVHAVEGILSGPWPVVATVALHGDGFIQRAKDHPNAILRSVNSQNRNIIPGRINAWLRRRFDASLEGWRQRHAPR